MPAYCFKCDKCSAEIDRVLPVSQCARLVKCKCGSDMQRDFVREHGGFRHRPGNWPMLSDAAGTHPSLINESRAYAEKVGVPTDFTPDGRAIFTSADHRKRYCEAHGLFDRNGGYSDPQRKRG